MSDFISKRFQKFFAKRAPRADTVKLNLRNVYIFFSRGGLLFALLLVITFITGINYGNNLVLGLCFYLASIWVISFHLTFAHVSGLILKLQNTELVQQGKPSWVSIDLSNDKSQPSRQLHLTFDHKQNLPSIDTLNEDQPIKLSNKSKVENTISDNGLQHAIEPSYTLASVQGTKRIQLPIMTYKRGKLVLPRLVISTVYPLGIMRAWSYVYFATPVWAYPKPKVFDMEALQMVSSDHEQELSAHTITGQNDFESLDEFQEGESLGRVSWAHVARGQGMLTKNFADPIGQEQRLDYRDMPAAHHEEKLSQLSYAVLQLAETGNPFQLNLPNDKGNVGQGEVFVQSCLLRLAKCP